jgi:hypothetical protein
MTNPTAPTAWTSAPSFDLRDMLSRKPVKPTFDLRQTISTRPPEPDPQNTDLRDRLSRKRERPHQPASKEENADDTLEGGEIDLHDGCKPYEHIPDLDKYEDGKGGCGGFTSGQYRPTLSAAYPTAKAAQPTGGSRGGRSR